MSPVVILEEGCHNLCKPHSLTHSLTLFLCMFIECDLTAQYKTILGQSCDMSELQMQKDFDERRVSSNIMIRYDHNTYNPC